MKTRQLLTSYHEKLRDYFRRILIVVSLAVIISLFRSIAKINKSQVKIEEAQNVVNKLEEENRELEKRLELVESEEFIERQLRDQLGLARKGEIVIILPDVETLKRLAPRVYREGESLPDPNWRKWMKLFF